MPSPLTRKGREILRQKIKEHLYPDVSEVLIKSLRSVARTDKVSMPRKNYSNLTPPQFVDYWIKKGIVARDPKKIKAIMEMLKIYIAVHQAELGHIDLPKFEIEPSEGTAAPNVESPNPEVAVTQDEPIKPIKSIFD